MTTEPRDHATCEDWLRSQFTDEGLDVVVSTEPFLVTGAYTFVDGEQCAMTCPHGVTFYFEPSGDQRAQWAKDGAR